MKFKKIISIILIIILSTILCCIGTNSVKKSNNKNSNIFYYNPDDIVKNGVLTVFGFSQSNTNSNADQQIIELNPDINIRSWQKWSKWGINISDYNFDAVNEYHDNNITFIGGGTASVIFQEEFDSTNTFNDIVSRDADNNPVTHNYIVNNAYRGSIANPDYRDHIINYCKIQIDGGVDGIFLDEVISAYTGGNEYNFNGNEGFEDDSIADFNKFLMEKFPDYTENDWKKNFNMTDNNIINTATSYNDLENNFNYREYLVNNNWNGSNHSNGPFSSQNPLAREWGRVTGNRMYGTNDTYTGKYLKIYWKEIVDELRTYAMDKYNKEILITSNGIFPYVDFNCLGMYEWNPDDSSSSRWADYVPVTNGHLNGSKSLMNIYKNLYLKNKEVAGDVPLILFIDWPTEMMTNYNNLLLSEKKDFWQIYTAEAYASGIYFAFHLRDTVGGLTAKSAGILKFLKYYSAFYKLNEEFYHNNDYSSNSVSINKQNVSYNLMYQQNENRYVLHLINHNYNTKINPQTNISVNLGLSSEPDNVFMISPDFEGMQEIEYEYDGNLKLRINKLKYYNLIIIGY